MYMVVDYSEDRELLTLLRRGEISAFVDIYTTYYDALLNYADRLLNDMEAARDVVQQVYYKMWENRDTLNISLSVKAYLFKSVYHGSLNTLAHQKNIQKYEQEQMTDFYFSTVIQSPEAEEALWKSDIEQAIQEAIATLPEKCREVFVLSKIEGLKNREIAEKLNISVNTVKTQKRKAYAFLREELQHLFVLFLMLLNL